MGRQFVGLIGLGLFGLIGLLLVRGALYGPPAAQQAVVLPEAPAIDVDRAAQALAEAIALRTVSIGPDQPREEAAWFALHDWLVERYPLAHDAMQRELIDELTLLYTWTGTDPTLPPMLLMAHQDVVPINMATVKDWTHPPFAGTVADGRIWGRGALDDKGSLVALMEAAETLLAHGQQPQRTVLLLFGHDEEIGGAGVQAAVELLRQRGVRPELVLDEGYMVLAEFPLTGRPTAIIGVAEKGYLTLKLTAPAAGGHSSMPPRESGAVRLARAIVALEDNQMPGSLADAPVADMLRGIAADMPFSQRVLIANSWLFGGLIDARLSASPGGNATLRTTTAPTMLEGSIKDNVLPQAASAQVNFRIHPRDSSDSVVEHVRRLVSPFGVEVEVPDVVLRSEPSPISPTDTRAWQTLTALARWAGDGAPVAPGLVIGATDARHVTPISDAAYRFLPIIATPAEIAGFHGTDEHLSVANMGRMVEGYARLMMGF